MKKKRIQVIKLKFFYKTQINVQAKYGNRIVTASSLPVTITLQDVNDHKPIFTTDTYNVRVSRLAKSTSQEILQFDVKDKDSGRYGLGGLVCSVLGHGSDKFFVDSGLQKIYLASDTSESDFEPNYYLTLMCKDDQGWFHFHFRIHLVL
jgi:hypothetical protein